LFLIDVLLLFLWWKDPSDRRKIICDEKLKDLFQVESFTGFTVSKLLAPHFTKTK
jgi:upstream activation factor subunit UAF30